MEFDTGRIGAPDQRREIVNEDVLNVRATRAPRHRESLDPIGSKARDLLFIENLTVDSIWEPFESNGAVQEMRQKKLRNADVVIDDLPFGKSAFGVEDLV